MIHACPDRMWYVKDYLIPSMQRQGIFLMDIEVFEDKDKLGNLKACLTSFMQLPDDDYGTWHLQDDVVLSKWFMPRTAQYDDGLVNGFCSKYCDGKPPGVVTPENMWYSFPCTRIPNLLARRFVRWFYQEAVNIGKYQRYIEENKFDDELFKEFIKTKYPGLRMRNLSPNLVDHIDYMIGGSTMNKTKAIQNDRRSKFWNEEDIIKELEVRLNGR